VASFNPSNKVASIKSGAKAFHATDETSVLKIAGMLSSCVWEDDGKKSLPPFLNIWSRFFL